MVKKLLASACSALALVSGLLLAPPNAHAEPSALTITQQPANVDVAYPAGATFHVEVSDPDQVESYQWIISDTYSDFVLGGSSATTDTLVIPSTMQDDPDLYARCVITDHDGNVVESEPGIMHVVNGDEDKTVLYVGDYAVEPGQTLDLSSTTLGTGTVTFDAGGTIVTLDNVHVSTETMTYDWALSPSLGIMLMRRNGDSPEYRFELVGENYIEDTYFDPDYNSGGIVFNSYFGATDDPNAPTVYLEGEGSLELRGGSYSIYSDSNVEVDATLVTEPSGARYCDSITCQGIFVGEGAKLVLHANGTALRAKGDLRVAKGASVEIASSAPHVSVGATAKSIVLADGSIYIDGATLAIQGFSDPEQFVPYGSMLANFVGISYGGNMVVTSSDVSIEMTEGEAEEPFVMSCYGISGDGMPSPLTLEGGSRLSVNVTMQDVLFVGGVMVSGSLEADEGCEVVVTAVSAGETAGIDAEQGLVLTDALLDSAVTSSEGLTTYGITGGGLVANITDPASHVHSIAEGGIALAADTGEHGEFEVEPEDGYAPEAIVLSDDAAIVTPAGGTVNLVGVPGYGETIRAETVFDPADMTTPASEVEIAIPTQGGGGGMGGAGLVVGACAIVAIAAVALLMARRGGTKRE